MNSIVFNIYILVYTNQQFFLTYSMRNEKTVFTKVKFIPKYPILEVGNF